MAIERLANVKEYYRRITEIDIGLIARKLLGTHVLHESDRLLQCDCPNHKSQSHRSLHIMLDKQGWYCFGCGVGGDVLQLVEFIQSGQVTRGQSGPMPESHQHARDFLASPAVLHTSLGKHVKRSMQKGWDLRENEAVFDDEFALFISDFIQKRSPLMRIRHEQMRKERED